MAKYEREARTYKFAVPVGGGGEFPSGAIPPPQLVLDLSMQARQVILSAFILDSVGNLIRGAATGAAGPITVLPYVIVGYTQNTLGGSGGAGQGAAQGQIVAPESPVGFVVPPNERLYATARGAPAGAGGVPLGTAFVALSVLSAANVEPAADGQTKRLIEGFKHSISEMVPRAILDAVKLMNMGK